MKYRQRPAGIGSGFPMPMPAARAVGRTAFAVRDTGVKYVVTGRSGRQHAQRSTVTGLRWLALGVCYALILLLALQNLGVDVTATVAGLGIGGIAIALAIQNILRDLFASLTIALDRPFVVGDFIIVGSEMGTVEHIGLKTTRVHSLSGAQLVFGNSDLWASRIRNFKRMRERRVVFCFGVVYDTPPESLECIPSLARKCVESVDGIRFDRCHFFRFGASSLDVEAVYYINTPDYTWTRSKQSIWRLLEVSANTGSSSHSQLRRCIWCRPALPTSAQPRWCPSTLLRALNRIDCRSELVQGFTDAAVVIPKGWSSEEPGVVRQFSRRTAQGRPHASVGMVAIRMRCFHQSNTGGSAGNH